MSFISHHNHNVILIVIIVMSQSSSSSSLKKWSSGALIFSALAAASPSVGQNVSLEVCTSIKDLESLQNWQMGRMGTPCDDNTKQGLNRHFRQECSIFSKLQKKPQFEDITEKNPIYAAIGEYFHLWCPKNAYLCNGSPSENPPVEAVQPFPVVDGDQPDGPQWGQVMVMVMVMVITLMDHNED